MHTLLKVTDLCVQFNQGSKVYRAVDGVTFEVAKGETVCLVGESGCGKSVTSLAVMKLVDEPGRVTGGSIWIGEDDILASSGEAMRAMRGRRVAMVFQEPMTSLNPVLSIHDQLIECLPHEDKQKPEAVLQMLLDTVGLESNLLNSYPHRLSGGQRQRVMIAMALANNPEILIADEPTTALDVSVQAQILDLLKRLRAERGMALLLITHDFGVVAEMADRVLVMYAGKIVEEGPVDEILRHSRHPYTRGLIRSIPRLDEPLSRLPTIEGQVPDSSDYPAGCRFHPRCQFAVDQCATDEPQPAVLGDDHIVSCWEQEKLAPQG